MSDFGRTERLIGQESLEKLSKARVAVFGLGGVGSYVVEALARSNVGALDLIDNDVVEESNINRQLIALISTMGQPKVTVSAQRVKDINPQCVVTEHQVFFLPENKDMFDFEKYDYIVDAIDTVSGKIALVEEARKHNVPIISSMGTGNKLDPTAFRVADIKDTKVCPLARVMRRELKNRGIESLKVVYSEEEPINKGFVFESEKLIASRRPLPSSIAFVPSVAGLIMAGEVIKDLIKQ